MKHKDVEPLNLIWNLFMVYACYMVCRVLFVIDNREILTAFVADGNWWLAWQGASIFDLAGMSYTNILYVVMALIPFHMKHCHGYPSVLKVVFFMVNAIGLSLSLMDSVYFKYTQHRVTSIVFDEFAQEGNLGKIFFVEFLSHWYFVVCALGMFYILWKFYANIEPKPSRSHLKNYYSKHILLLLIFVPLTIYAMRGCKFTTATRPLSVNDAMNYVSRVTDANVVLNTPFALIRTMNKKPAMVAVFFEDRAEMQKLFSPIHIPDANREMTKKNVCILIVESFAQEFWGSLNKHLDGGTYKGYTPFADSILNVSLSYEQSFSSGGFSIDAMPAVLTSIPRMDHPFVLSPYSLNHITGIAHLLKKEGYTTAFFHGAENGSMGFESFAYSAGFDRYYGRTEYNQDKRFGGDRDFDGTWAIWDEEYLQHYCLMMNDMKEPFLSAVFTATSHHPFALPERYKSVYPDEGQYPIHKCIRYTDHALQHFFDTAKKQPWYKNTIFVLTADHASSRTTHDEYKTELGGFRIPILFYDPSGELPRERRKGIIQQIDIMPTVLSCLGYNKPYFAFGKDMLMPAQSDMWAMNWDRIPQFIMGDYVLQHNGTNAVALYNYISDSLMAHNLITEKPQVATTLQKRLEAFMQVYSECMKADSLNIKK